MSNNSSVSDEELILSAHAGSAQAKNELDRRYCGSSLKHALRVCPGVFAYLGRGEINNAAFTSYLNCYDSYVPGDVPFFSYYAIALAHALGKEKSDFFKRGGFCQSLSAPCSKGSTLTMHEVLEAAPLADPRKNLNYTEEVEAVRKAPESMNEEVIEVGRLKAEGLSLTEIAIRLGMSKKMAWYRSNTYVEGIKRLLDGKEVKNKGEVSEDPRIAEAIYFSKRRQLNPAKDPLALVSFKKGMPYNKQGNRARKAAHQENKL